MEVTLEMGCEKTVHSQQTMAIYGQNKQSLFDFLEWFELIRLKFQPSKMKITWTRIQLWANLLFQTKKSGILIQDSMESSQIQWHISQLRTQKYS